MAMEIHRVGHGWCSSGGVGIGRWQGVGPRLEIEFGQGRLIRGRVGVHCGGGQTDCIASQKSEALNLFYNLTLSLKWSDTIEAAL